MNLSSLFSAAAKLMSFFVLHKDEIKQFVLGAESLMEAAAGAEKMVAVRAAIAAALGVESQIEAVWPLVAPFFNSIVAEAKKGATPNPPIANLS